MLLENLKHVIKFLTCVMNSQEYSGKVNCHISGIGVEAFSNSLLILVSADLLKFRELFKQIVKLENQFILPPENQQFCTWTFFSARLSIQRYFLKKTSH